MLYNRCIGIYKFGKNTYPRRIRCRSNLGHIFQEKKVRLVGREIQYVWKTEDVIMCYLVTERENVIMCCLITLGAG